MISISCDSIGNNVVFCFFFVVCLKSIGQTSNGHQYAEPKDIVHREPITQHTYPRGNVVRAIDFAQ